MHRVTVLGNKKGELVPAQAAGTKQSANLKLQSAGMFGLDGLVGHMAAMAHITKGCRRLVDVSTTSCGAWRTTDAPRSAMSQAPWASGSACGLQGLAVNQNTPVCRVGAVHAEERSNVTVQVVWPVEGNCHHCCHRSICIVRACHTTPSLVPRGEHPLL